MICVLWVRTGETHACVVWNEVRENHCRRHLWWQLLWWIITFVIFLNYESSWWFIISGIFLEISVPFTNISEKLYVILLCVNWSRSGSNGVGNSSTASPTHFDGAQSNNVNICVRQTVCKRLINCRESRRQKMQVLFWTPRTKPLFKWWKGQP